MVYVCDSGTWCSSDTWLYRTWRQSNREPSRKCETPCVTFRGQQDCLRPAHLIETLSSWWGHLAVAFRTRRPLLLAALPVQRVSHLTVDSGLTPTSLTGTTHCSTTYSVFFVSFVITSDGNSPSLRLVLHILISSSFWSVDLQWPITPSRFHLSSASV